ncbi:hypothetical protein HWV62_24898, partial [Athelia sp. TMB]
MGILRHRKQTPPDDVESAAATSETANGGQEKRDPYANGDEYDILLRFAADEAAKLEHGDKDDEEEEVQYTRPWYAPWKKVKKESSKEKKVPSEWLKTDLTQGLPDSEIEKRRQGYGYNELSSPHENQILKFISYFRGPILYVMEIAVVLSAGLQDWIDFGVIIGILMLNAGVGWYQEKQAGDIVAQLKAGIAMKATVVRNGKESKIEARDLVAGDIVVLEEGSTIPADAKILGSYEDKDGSKVDSSALRKLNISKKILEKLESKNGGRNSSTAGEKNKKGEEESDDEDDGIDKGPSLCSVDQSAITGESLAVDKYIGDVAYYTCGVKRGK